MRLGILTGRDKGKTRAAIYEKLASGEIDIAIGTHALFQEDVAFRDLAMAVIDEQHRFGVHQRLQLSAKGRGVDVLVMTATPIPRTLTLTAYGDMDVSRLTEKPPGRKPVTTITIPLERLEEVIAGIGRKIAEGARVYWVCPLVEESEVMDLAAATDRHALLRSMIGERVGLVHGKMKPTDKDAVMTAFAGGDLDVLVATTVIEVGVNVPEASVMVIEHAERFGLAQLHQLRGRIGRGTAASTCLLLYDSPLSETSKARLAIMKGTEDGFLHRGGRPAPAGSRRSARHPPERHAGVPPCRSGRPWRAAGGGPRRREADHGPRSGTAVGARQGAARPALPVRTRSGGEVSPLRLKLGIMIEPINPTRTGTWSPIRRCAGVQVPGYSGAKRRLRSGSR